MNKKEMIECLIFILEKLYDSRYKNDDCDMSTLDYYDKRDVYEKIIELRHELIKLEVTKKD